MTTLGFTAVIVIVGLLIHLLSRPHEPPPFETRPVTPRPRAQDIPEAPPRVAGKCAFPCCDCYSKASDQTEICENRKKWFSKN